MVNPDTTLLFNNHMDYEQARSFLLKPVFIQRAFAFLLGRHLGTDRSPLLHVLTYDVIRVIIEYVILGYNRRQ